MQRDVQRRRHSSKQTKKKYTIQFLRIRVNKCASAIVYITDLLTLVKE